MSVYLCLSLNLPIRVLLVLPYLHAVLETGDLECLILASVPVFPLLTCLHFPLPSSNLSASLHLFSLLTFAIHFHLYLIHAIAISMTLLCLLVPSANSFLMLILSLCLLFLSAYSFPLLTLSLCFHLLLLPLVSAANSRHFVSNFACLSPKLYAYTIRHQHHHHHHHHQQQQRNGTRCPACVMHSSLSSSALSSPALACRFAQRFLPSFSPGLGSRRLL